MEPPRVEHVISGSMEPSEIAAILVEHDIKDITDEFNEHSITTPSAGGGWGDIYKGAMRDGRAVAVKRTTLYPKHPEFSFVLKESAQELSVWSKCRHPNVMELIGFTILGGRFAMVAPWMEGGDARAFIQQRLGKVNRLDICQKVANGLCYFHEKRMVHGDLKAQNVLVSGDGSQVKLTDLGSAKIRSHSISLSTSRSELKSILWAPPELLREGAAASFESDVYSLGMTILEVITGERPFPEYDEGVAVALLIIAGNPKDGREIPAPTPKRPECCIPNTESGNHIWKLLQECWSQSSAKRPNILEVRNRLDSAHLDETEMKAGRHVGKRSFPVCNDVEVLTASV